MMPKPSASISRHLAPVEIVVHSGQRGPAGAPGEPGAGVQIKGVAATWPPATTPAEGDLWILPNPVPAGTPAGFDPGDGAAWDGSAWVNTGPIKGEDGADGPPTVVVSTTPPAPPTVDGFLWVDPDGDGSAGVITNAPFDAAAPIEYVAPPVTVQADGTPIGLSADGQTFHKPEIVGAVPVVIGGKRYLIPIIKE
jgi:hypothetical protein